MNSPTKHPAPLDVSLYDLQLSQLSQPLEARSDGLPLHRQSATRPGECWTNPPTWP
jgi:hypothetical protein